VFIYKKSNENAAQTRYRCFVNSDEGEKIGSFEVVQKDKNDEKTIIDKIADWYKRLKNLAITVTNEIKAISELVATLNGIIKDLSSSSSLIKIPFLIFFFISLLF